MNPPQVGADGQPTWQNMEGGGGYTVSPLQTAVDTEQFRKLQESERYGIHVSGTKKYLTEFQLILHLLTSPLIWITLTKMFSAARISRHSGIAQHYLLWSVFL